MSSFQVISNIDLEELAANWGIPLVGVFSKDQLSGQPHSGGYIVNLQDWDEGGGSHWVALYIEGKNAGYCDSFGQHPPQDVKDFVKKATKKYNMYVCVDQIQHLKSEACGYYCLAFIAYMRQMEHVEFTLRLNYFADMFDTQHLQKNDTTLRQFFHPNGFDTKTSQR